MSPAGDRALLDLAGLEQRAALSRLNQPFLSVIGGRDVFVPPEIGRLAATLAPRGQAVEFAECGHAPFLEDPAGYRAALLAFIAQLD
jgi:pimeloyl-ACP methyl ester carboxylesterase